MNVRAFTFVSSSPKKILDGLSRVFGDVTADSAQTALFCLSSNVEPTRLGSLVSSLRSLSHQHVGCISAPHIESSEEIVCSVALIPSSQCLTWRSAFEGKKQPQVGRVHPPTSQHAHPEEIAGIPSGLERPDV